MTKPSNIDEQALLFYQTVQQYEHHFNGIEFEVRKLASTWLIISFAAIAFLIRGDLVESQSLIGAVPLIAMIALLAQVGLFMLWILDQMVYHNLLDAVFTTALHIERNNPDLPPVRSAMRRISGGTGMARYLKLFYVVPMIVFAAIAAAATWVAINRGSDIGPLLVAFTLITVALPTWVWLKSGMVSRSQLDSRAAPHGDETRDDSAEIVERWVRSISKH